MLQFKVGDTVVYGVHGVCSIRALEEQTVAHKKVTYYVLEPTDQTCSRFFVPAYNASAVAKMKKILTKEELENILLADTSEEIWMENENSRKQHYRELLVSGDRSALIRMVRCLYSRRNMLLEAGKKFHQCDESFLRDAQKLLDSEFAYVLDIPKEQVKEYVLSKLDA